MTREEAKKLLPFIQAFSEGKQIQWLKPDSDEWIDVVGGDNVDFEDLTEFNVAYRIKPEPNYRPFNNARECWEEMKKHQPFGWISNGELLFNIISIGAGITIHNSISNCGYSFKSAVSLTFADGTPFGILEKE